MKNRIIKNYYLILFLLIGFVGNKSGIAKPIVEGIQHNNIEFTEIKEAKFFSRIHNVEFKVSSFKMSTYEITFDQYDLYCNAKGLPLPEDDGWGRGNRPVINITANDAENFCKWLGNNYRLPTLVEWEYACVAMSNTEFYTGNTLSTTEANYNGNYSPQGGEKGIYRRKTLPVGSFLPNTFGLHDLYGNVAEYVLSYSNVYTIGGSWDSDAESCVPLARKRSSNLVENNTTGFRIVYSPETVREVYADFIKSENERRLAEDKQQEIRKKSEPKEIEEKSKSVKSAQNNWYNGFHLAIGGKLSTLGYGVEVVVSMADWVKGRAGINNLNYNHNFNTGIKNYNSKNGYEANVESYFDVKHGHLLVDILPGARSPFHFTLGMYIGEFTIRGSGYLPQNQSSNLDRLALIHEDEYYLLDLKGSRFYDVEVRFANKVKPYIGIGFGRSIPKHLFGVKLDIGMVYQGEFSIYQYNERLIPISNLDYPGVSLPNLSKDVLKWWPVINLQIGIRLY